MTSDRGREFDCSDCGEHVVQIVPIFGGGNRCLHCRFLAQIEDPTEREQLRQRMVMNGTIEGGKNGAP